MRRKRRTRWLMAVLLALVVGTGVGFSVAQTSAPQGGASEAAQGASDNGATEGVSIIVDPSLLVDAGPSIDGIPSIDAPCFESVASADTWLQDDASVLVVEYQGACRAYPLQILVWHEIVNDAIAGDPLLITYCPLCASSAVYLRTVNGHVFEFGTSGKLYNSNLVMYDRTSGTYWSQLDGNALAGNLTGQALVRISADVVRWGDWKTTQMDADVLSRETGFDRDYTQNPYAAYLLDDAVCFPLSERDTRLPFKTPVIGVRVGETSIAVTENMLIARGSVDLRVDGQRIRLAWLRSGAVRATDLDTGEPLIVTRAFWFAWYAFHPETQLHR